MEFILEILLELILEGTLEISKNNKVPKMIRYPAILFIIILFVGVTVLIFLTGVLAYQKINKICGIFFGLLGIIFLIASNLKLKKLYLRKQNKQQSK